jgi:tetratricopeptide (TPR) repeat protein
MRLTVLLVLALLAVPAAAQQRAPKRPAPATPARDTLAGRYANEESIRRYLSGRLYEQSGRLTEALGEYYRALSLDPRSADVLVRISQICAQLGDPARSLEFSERALQIDADESRALWLKGAALFSLNRAAEALAPLERACEVDSTQIEVLRTTARVAESLQRPDAAERAWRRIVWVDDEDGEAWFQIAQAEARRGDLKAAEQSLARATELNPVRPGLLFLTGWVKENLGRPEEAIALYEEHLSVHPTDVGTRRRLVGLYMRANRMPEAYEEAKLVVRADPRDPESLQVLADLAYRTKHESEGEQTLNQLRAINPGDPENTARAVVVLARNQRGREAARIADQWAHDHPGHPAGPMLSVRAWTSAGMPDTAVARARRAVAAAPDSAEPRRLLARALVEAKRYDEASREFAKLVEKYPQEPGFLLDLGGSLERGGDIDGAIDAGRRALKLAPDWPPALNFLGYVLADHKRELKEALRMVEQAIARDPDNGAYVDSHGWALYRLGRLEEAREKLERAVLLTEGDAVVREHLGDVYRDLGLKDRAKEQYQGAVALKAENQKRVEEKLRAIR